MNIADRFTLRVLREGPATSDQLAAELGMKLDSMRVVMTSLHHAKQVHVHAWCRGSSGHLRGIWKLGQGEDVPKPKHEAKVVEPRRPMGTIPGRPRKRHPSVEQINAITAGVFNPFATAMWNVERGQA